MCQHRCMETFLCFLFFCFISQNFITCRSDTRQIVKILVLFQNGQDKVEDWLEETLRRTENNLNSRVKFESTFHLVDMNDMESITPEKLCSEYFEKGIAIVIDVTWGNDNWKALYKQSQAANLPYIKLDITIGPTLRILDAFLKARNATDVTIIFDTANEVHEALFYWVDKTSLRMLMMEGLDEASADRVRIIKPMPSYYVIIANTESMYEILTTARDRGLITLPERWILLFLDMRDISEIKALVANELVSIIYYDTIMCCTAQRVNCDECEAFDPQQNFFIGVVTHMANIINDLIRDHPEMSSSSYNCTENSFPEDFAVNFNTTKYPIFTVEKNLVYTPYFSAIVEMGRESGIFEIVGKYTDKEKFKQERDAVIPPIKKFFRIGTAPAIPWTYMEIDPKTKKTYWTGYCIDFAKKLAEVMNFNYEIVIPKSKSYGKRDANGYWTGTVGDLVRGDTDMIIGALTMTAEREEVIDFVAPYFEQTGISIVMRKPVRKTSLFKFMTVLRLEVWLSIVAALVVTGFMIWILDKYSPYSARNNAKAYPYPCRKFTLKESFWFALTSFTPQGGGEAPKALSGRTLVAAYWLFVVLMLATFTANLAAFLTVERMQSPVQSLEQLAKQSRINYTVMKNSWSHQYFINMKFAEDTLYRLWKELTLNASTDQTQYRVWDYPIREQYGHILLAINDSMPVDNATEGFEKVVEHIDADFAFIHDSSEIKYEISRNCNLTEIGEVFAERPYAVAVQQGSYMSDDISKAILDLQKERFFEGLKAKYWNNSVKGICPDSEDSEGITLESLGGVFIATLFGLALAMLTLLAEVIYYKKKKPLNKVMEVKPGIDDNKIESPKKNWWSLKKRNKKDGGNKFSPKSDAFTKEGEIKQVTIGDSFQPVLKNKIKPVGDTLTKGNYFTVYSRPPLHPDKDYDYWNRNYLY